MSNQSISGLAVLAVNEDRGRDALDLILPLVGHQANTFAPSPVTAPQIAEGLHDDFGVMLPVTIVRAALRRLGKRGLLEVRDSAYYPLEDKLAKYDFSENLRDADARFEGLIQDGIAFASQRFELELDDLEFESNLISCIGKVSSDFELIDRKQFQEDNLTREEGIVAQFLSQEISKSDGHRPELTQLARGAMIVSALSAPGSTENTSQRYRTHLYLDTTVLLRAIGACGPVRQRFSNELLDSAKKCNLPVKCFSHNINEIRGILASAAHAVARPTSPYFGEVHEYVVSQGWRRSDVEVMSANLEVELSKLGIEIVDKPAPESFYAMDEVKMEEIFKRTVNYRERRPLLADVDSIVAIHRLRHAQEFSSIDNCKALFVTNNTALVRASRIVYRDYDFQAGAVPPALIDYEVASFLWLKLGAVSESLASSALATRVFAATEPDRSVWEKFSRKLEELRMTDRVNQHDYTILRQSGLARAILLDKTDGDPEAFAEDDISFVLQRAQSEREASLSDELARMDEENRELSEAMSSLNQSLQDTRQGIEQEREERSRERAELNAATESTLDGITTKLVKKRVWQIKFGLAVVVVLSGTLGTFSIFGNIFPEVVKDVAATVFLLFSIAGIVGGWSLKTRMPRIEECLYQKFRQDVVGDPKR